MLKQDIAVIIGLALFIFMCRKVRIKIKQRHFLQQLQYRHDVIYNTKKRIKRYNIYFWNYFNNDDFGNYEYDKEQLYEKIKIYFNSEINNDVNKINIIKKDIIGHIECYINYDIGNYTTLLCTILITSLTALFSLGKISYNDFNNSVGLIFIIVIVAEFYRLFIYDVYGDKRSFFILCKEIITDIENKIINDEKEEKERLLQQEMINRFDRLIELNIESNQGLFCKLFKKLYR